MTTKRCFRCGVEQELSAFYAHPQMGDGHLNKCKECTKSDVAAHQRRMRKNPAWLAKERARCVEKQTRYNAVAKRKWPEKFKARIALHNATTRGALKKPLICQRCGTRKRRRRDIQAHHADYSKPLEVTFVCAPCHAVLDGRARPF